MIDLVESPGSRDFTSTRTWRRTPQVRLFSLCNERSERNKFASANTVIDQKLTANRLATG